MLPTRQALSAGRARNPGLLQGLRTNAHEILKY
jgi:hypothetical protein